MIEVKSWNDLKGLPQPSMWETFCAKIEQHPNCKIILFGAGDQGMMTAHLLHNYGFRPYGFCDNNKSIQGMQLKGLPVFSPENLVKLGKDAVIINNDSWRVEKRKQLLSLGVDDTQIFSLDVFSPIFKEMTRDYVEAHELEFQSVFSSLADEESKRVYLNYLAGTWTGNLNYFASAQYINTIEGIRGKYFPKELVPERNDHVFVDIGAFNGNSIEWFIRRFPKYEKIYAFEPSKASAAIIREKNFPRTKLFEVAASDRDDVSSFSCDDYRELTMLTAVPHHFGKQRTEAFHTVRLDTVLKNDDGQEEQRVSFIKIDTTGSELAALRGAQETMRRWNPFVAVSAYFRKEDLFEIPACLRQLMPGCKIYARLHSSSAMDFVFYACR